MALELKPIGRDEANDFIRARHRHHQPNQGYKFAIGLSENDRLCGVVVVGRPVSRHLDDGYTAEVTRLCTDGTKNACSMLYAAAWRATRAMGYKRLITYILKDEPGTSLRAAGWRLIGETRGGSWDRPGRARIDKAPTCQKKLYEMT